MIIHDHRDNKLYLIGQTIQDENIIYVPPELYEFAVSLIKTFCQTPEGAYDGKDKIRCIKALKIHFTVGLREAKDAFDAAFHKIYPQP